MRPINAAILLITLTASAHAVEQNVGASPDNALAVPIPPAVTSTIVPTDTAPIEAPPLPRPKPSVTGDNPAALISAFRRQHGEGSVTIDGALTRIAQEQANAMAVRDSLDHNALAPFSSRMSRSRFNRAAENIAYGHADFASTLKQWTNSAGHRANLLLHGAKWIGVAHAQNGRRMYWAMVIGGEIKDHAVYSNIRR
ncbi:MAG: CAP domain-containing protein [Pseudolabrys sp.]